MLNLSMKFYDFFVWLKLLKLKLIHAINVF